MVGASLVQESRGDTHAVSHVGPANVPVNGGTNARAGCSVARAMSRETAPVYADVRARAQRSVTLISTLFDRLSEIHDTELVMWWADPEVSPCKKCGYEEP